MKKPPIKRKVNSIARRLKYFSIKNAMLLPKTFIKDASKKNLALLLINDANKNIPKLILNVPDERVINLNGMGVKPAVKTIQKSHSSYNLFILLKPSSFTPGIYSIKRLAK